MTRPIACVARDAKLQTELDLLESASNTLLAIRDPLCGTTVYVSGDPSVANASSLWRVGGATTSYVAAAVLSLASQGKLSLGDPLSRWVPGVANTEAVTVRMLLNHTSGIFNFVEKTELLQSAPAKDWTPREIVALAETEPPYFPPGTGWHRSSTNYILLGMVLEAAGGATASALIRQHVLDPAGLDHTFLEGAEPLVGTLAASFDSEGRPVTGSNFGLYWTAAAMVATGADLCDWIATLLGSDKVLGEAERTQMIEGAVTAVAGISTYGLGIELIDAKHTDGAGPALGHFDSIGWTHRSEVYWFPDSKTAICSIRSQPEKPATEITLLAFKELFGD